VAAADDDHVEVASILHPNRLQSGRGDADPSTMWTYVLRHREELRRIYSRSEPVKPGGPEASAGS